MPSPSPIILLVDDEPLGREMLEAVLGDDGYRLATASDGQEALVKARELLPDLILLDVMMPALDGFEVLRRLRADPATAALPVILVTALNDRESRLEGLRAGADDFVAKPIDSAELLARVRTITRLDRFRRLQGERAKFEWVVESADDAFLVVDAGDHVTYANPRARLLLDLAPDAALPLATRFRTLTGALFRCEPEPLWQSWPASPVPAASRYLVRPESRVVHTLWLEVETFALPRREDEGWLVRLRDVTARVHARREVWAFHSAVHHKFRTPIAAMIPSLEMLATSAASLGPEATASFASAAFRGAVRLQGAIQDVLDYLDASREPWAGEGLDVGEVPAMVKDAAVELGIESVVVSGEAAAGGVRAALSRRALELVLWELMDNARKFHPRRAPAVEVLVTRPSEGRVGLTVRDDGISLPAEHLARAFSPYYQGEKQHTGQVAGMGLGLPMVGSIVWSLGGSCRLVNRSDRPGVAVELTLPIG